MKKRGPYKVRASSQSGVTGIVWHKVHQKWEIRGIGYFRNLGDAKAALSNLAQGLPIKRDKKL